jgi:hypothetical protein
LAEDFELPEERQRADAVMNRYLKDALCLLDKGHKWYVDLAEQYELRDAKRYIEGFYATVYGKVEIETSDGRKPARGAIVTIRDPHDGMTWQTTANNEGQYEIKKAILHRECSPFEIGAEWKGNRTRKTYGGPLTEPDPSKRHKVDLLIAVCVGGTMDIVTDIKHTMRTEDGTGVVHIRESGSIPFTVDFSVEPPRVEGEGTWQSNGPPSTLVHVSGITLTALYNPVVIEKLHGTLIENGSDPMTLEFWFNRSCDGGRTWTPQGPHEPIPLVDGFTKSYPANSIGGGHTASGTITVTLHLDNQD